MASATSVRCSPSTSWLLDSAATYQQTHGQPGTARPLLEWALHLNEAAYGPGHPHVANALSKLARALVDLDRAGHSPIPAGASTTHRRDRYGPNHQASVRVRQALRQLDDTPD